jgi:hypothetical protein
MARIWNLISHLLAGMSLFGLVHSALGATQMSGLVRWSLEALRGLLDAAFSDFVEWLSQYLSYGIVWLLGLTPVLEAHWQNIFVLLTLYFFRDSDQFFRIKYVRSGVVSLVWGFFVALCAGVAAGLLPLAQSGFGAYVTMVAIPLAAYVAYAFGATLANAIWYRQAFADYLQAPVEPFFAFLGKRMLWAMQRAFGGFLIALAGFVALMVWPVPSPGLFMVAALVLVLAVYWLYRGTVQALAQSRSNGRSLGQSLWASGNITMGLDMFVKCLTGAGIWGTDTALQNLGL